MRFLNVLSAAFLVSASFAGSAHAQCTGGLIVNCPSVVNLQPTDVIPVWQLGQNPHMRAASLNSILGGGGTLPGNFSTLAVTNNATIGGTLGVTGATTLGNVVILGPLPTSPVGLAHGQLWNDGGLLAIAP